MRNLPPAANDRWGASAARLGSEAASLSIPRPIRTKSGPFGSRRDTSSGSPEMVAKILRSSWRVALAKAAAGVSGWSPLAIARSRKSASVFLGIYLSLIHI